MTRVEDDANDTTISSILQIHSALTSLNYTGIEIAKLKCHDSWNGGILVIVSGFVKSRNFSGRRRFTQAFFLAPQEKGFFVLNDIFQFIDEDSANQHPVPEIPEVKVDSEVNASSHLEQPASNFTLEEETREYVNSIHIEEDNPVDKYSIPDEQKHEEPEVETVVEEALVEESLPLETAAENVQDTTPAPVNETVGEPSKLTYASILQSAPSQPTASVRKSAPPPSESYHRVQTVSPPVNPSATSFAPEGTGAGAEEVAAPVKGNHYDVFSYKEDGTHIRGAMRSVYVRNLPAHVTADDIEKQFKNFGRIKPNGVVIKNRKDIGVCFAFVEYEDIVGVQNAIKASTIELLGRQVFIEERRAGSESSSRGGGTGRGRGRGLGRGNYQTDALRGRGSRNAGRGSIPDSGDYNRIQGNGYHQRL
ncbi:hypothetical protein Ancab_021993 [Ancistrocladus abbreviatus]